MEKGRREAGIAKESCWICGGPKKEDTGSESGRIKRGSGIETGVQGGVGSGKIRLNAAAPTKCSKCCYCRNTL